MKNKFPVSTTANNHLFTRIHSVDEPRMVSIVTKTLTLDQAKEKARQIYDCLSKPYMISISDDEGENLFFKKL